MLVTDGGSVTEINDLQPWKAYLLIIVTDGDSVTDDNDVQS